MYNDLRIYRPRYQARAQLTLMKRHLEQLTSLVTQVSDDRASFEKRLTHLKEDIVRLHEDYFALKSVPAGKKASILPKTEIEQQLKSVRTQIDSLVHDLKEKLAEQERFRRLQEQLEAERKARAEEERRQKELEELRRRKAELEERARLELEREQVANKAALEAANQAAQQQARISQTSSPELLIDEGSFESGSYDSLTFKIDEEERKRQAEALKRIEQEKRDLELARRLAQDSQCKSERASSTALLNDDIAAAVQAAGYGSPVTVCLIF